MLVYRAPYHVNITKAHFSAASADKWRYPRRGGSSLPVLLWVLCGSLVLLTLRYLVPHYVEEMNYAAARGRQRAEVEIAAEGLGELKLDSLSIAYQLVSKRVSPSVVHIQTEKTSTYSVPPDELKFLFGTPETFRSQGQGSGVIMDEEGYILTNNHVVQGASGIHVSLNEGRTVPARIIGEDWPTDLALIKIETKGLLAAEWGNSDRLEVGALVWAVGSPFGLDQSITAGIVSAKDRQAGPHQQFLQTDAAVNPGNSGGPLVDALGRVVGINTAIVGRSYQGISFAIPSMIAQEIYEELKLNGSVARGWLGVGQDDVNSANARRLGVNVEAGAVVVAVLSDSPALAAGIEPGDVIVRWNGQEVADAFSLTQLVVATEIDSTVDVVILRDGQEMTLRVKVGLRPPAM